MGVMNTSARPPRTIKRDELHISRSTREWGNTANAFSVKTIASTVRETCGVLLRSVNKTAKTGWNSPNDPIIGFTPVSENPPTRLLVRYKIGTSARLPPPAMRNERATLLWLATERNARLSDTTHSSMIANTAGNFVKVTSGIQML
jgi:hypothetical protein